MQRAFPVRAMVITSSEICMNFAVKIVFLLCFGALVRSDYWQVWTTRPKPQWTRLWRSDVELFEHCVGEVKASWAMVGDRKGDWGPSGRLKRQHVRWERIYHSLLMHICVTWPQWKPGDKLMHEWTGGRFKNTYELLNLRALKYSRVNKIHIFQCMGKIFCVEFQRYPLKFHTKNLTHTVKDMIFIQHWNFKSS